MSNYSTQAPCVISGCMHNSQNDWTAILSNQEENLIPSLLLLPSFPSPSNTHTQAGAESEKSYSSGTVEVFPPSLKRVKRRARHSIVPPHLLSLSLSLTHISPFMYSFFWFISNLIYRLLSLKSDLFLKRLYLLHSCVCVSSPLDALAVINYIRLLNN